MNGAVVNIFICSLMTAVLLCHFNECKPTGISMSCDLSKEFEVCVNLTKRDTFNRSAELDVSSLRYAVDLDTQVFTAVCLSYNNCAVRILLNCIGHVLQPEWQHCLDDKTKQQAMAAYKYLNSIRHTPEKFDLETFQNMFPLK
uniref:Uncharacterized protein n=1 Tax=Trichobilharzia regenti TaxID=157069 RepID=A0AA85JN17_TRIRE|nr:unnamed protein product [Trichobilharzia regenti]